MNSDPVLIWWIDDKDEHRKAAKEMEKKTKNSKVIFFKPEDVSKMLGSSSLRKIPNLFLVDYRLDSQRDKFRDLGLTMEGKIRENYPDIPVYGFTLYPKRKNFYEKVVKKRFDKILDFKDIQRCGHIILHKDALTYRKIKSSRTNDPEELFRLIKAPNDIKQRLRTMLPDELHGGLTRSGAATKYPGDTIIFARWVRQSLMARPGFLYNSLHTATHLGMIESAFKKISKNFESARYKGVFYETEQPLWWVCVVDEILLSQKKTKSIKETNPWEIAPLVFKIPTKNQTKCAVCGEKYPETVGFNLTDEEEQPVHYKCSNVDRNKKTELYFDEPRSFKINSG